MNIDVIFALVAIQVLVFQLLGGRFAAALAGGLPRRHDLPPEAAAALDRERAGAGHGRQLLGGLLLVAAALLAYVLPLGYAARKLGIAAVSVLSSLVLAAGFALDRRRLLGLLERIPDPGWRAASLQRRTLGRYYHPLWEAVPPLIWAATLLATFRLAPATSSPPPAAAAASAGPTTLGLYALPALQAVLVVVLLLLTFRTMHGGGDALRRLGVLLGDPHGSVELGEALRRLEMRSFVALKICVIAMLAAAQVVKLLAAGGHQLPLLLREADMLVVVVMVASYAAYLLRARRLAQQVERPAAG